MKKVMLVILLLCLSPGVLAAPERISDPVSYDSYLEEFGSPASDTRTSGEIWSDKSVIAGDPQQGKRLEIDGNEISFDSDFLEIFSALGSVCTINTKDTAPTDTVLLLDVSTSMGKVVGDDTLIGKILQAANETIDSLLSDPQNRVGVIAFARDTVDLIPLDYYKRASDGTYLTLESLTYKNELKKTAAYVDIGAKITKTDDTDLETHVSTYEDKDGNIGEVSFQQLGLYKAFQMLLNDPREGSLPRLAFLSDGFSNVVSDNWQDPTQGIFYTNTSKAKYYALSILSTLLTASYMKSQVNQIYSYPAEILSFGIDLDEANDKEITQALIDPGEYFKASEDPYIGEAYSSYESWLAGDGKVTVTDDGEEYEVELKQNEDPQVSNDELKQNIAFVDTYAGLSSEDLPGRFSEPLSKISQTTFDPIDDTLENASGDVGGLTYVDPIGEGMKISRILYGEFGGDLFPVVEDDTGIHLQGNDEKELPVELKDVKIEISNEGDGESLIVRLPQPALPLVNTVVQTEKDSFLIEDNLGQTSSLPFRLFYTIDHVTEGELYTNRFTDNTYPELENSQGDAYVSFIASRQNPFYFIQDGHTVYQNSTGGEGEIWSETNEDGTRLSGPINDPAQIDANGTYYIEDTYYRTGKARSSGECYKYCFSLSGQELLNTNARTGETGLRRYGNLSDFVVEKQDNTTSTADLRLAPYAPQEQTPGLIIDQLGNNGRMVITHQFPELSLVKKHALSQTESEATTEPMKVNLEDAITYTLTLKNDGMVPAYDVTVTDPVPEGLTISSIGQNGVSNNNVISWVVPVVEANDQVTLSFTAKVPSDASAKIFENTAYYKFEDLQISSNTVQETLDPPGELEIEKEQGFPGDDPTKEELSVSPDDSVTYYLTVNNPSSAPVSALVTDTIQAGLDVDDNSISDAGEQGGDTITWDLGILEPNEEKTVSFTATVTSEFEAPYTNTAFVKSEQDVYASNTVVLNSQADPTSTTTTTPSEPQSPSSSQSTPTVSTPQACSPASTGSTGSGSTGSSCTSPKTGVKTLAPLYTVVLLGTCSLLGFALKRKSIPSKTVKDKSHSESTELC